jgi:hypothetical protein
VNGVDVAVVVVAAIPTADVGNRLGSTPFTWDIDQLGADHHSAVGLLGGLVSLEHLDHLLSYPLSHAAFSHLDNHARRTERRNAVTCRCKKCLTRKGAIVSNDAFQWIVVIELGILCLLAILGRVGK